MELQTRVERPRYDFTIGYRDRILSLGSCFAQRTAEMLEHRQFSIQSNPLGIVYNPVSVRQTLDFVRTRHEFTPEQIFRHDELWHGYHCNQWFSHPDPKRVLEKANQRIREVDPTRISRLLLTFGTAQAYEHRATGITVANNHRLPAAAFRPYRVDLTEEGARWVRALEQFRAQTAQPDRFRVLLTVSPVRHRRDGFVANQRSKAVLLLLCEYLSAELPYVHYFPSYEIVMDELRDYRFYGDDLLHPGNNATEYIHEIFSEIFFTPETQKITDEIDAIGRAARHRPRSKFSEAHRQFLQTQIGKIETLRTRYPQMDPWMLEAHFRGELQLVEQYFDGKDAHGSPIDFDE